MTSPASKSSLKMSPCDLESPIVSILRDGKSLTIYEPARDGEPPRNRIQYVRVGDYFQRAYTNYYGHVVKEEVDPLEGDFEANGYLTFHGWLVESKS